MTPLETICDELEHAGVKRFDVKAFLLGLSVGRMGSLNNEPELRRIVRIHYPPVKRKRAAAKT